MWTLVKRELSDVVIFLITIQIITITALAISGSYLFEALEDKPYGLPIHMYSILTIGGIILTWLASIFGCYQMQTDKTHKVSTFLCTLAATRQTILLSRIITGLIFTLLPIILTAIMFYIALQFHPRVFDLGQYSTILIKMFFTLTLLAITNYAFGLQLGLSFDKDQKQIDAGKFLLLLTAISLLLIILVYLKGIGLTCWMILLLLSTCSFWLLFNKYTKVPL